MFVVGCIFALRSRLCFLDSSSCLGPLGSSNNSFENSRSGLSSTFFVSVELLFDSKDFLALTSLDSWTILLVCVLSGTSTVVVFVVSIFVGIIGLGSLEAFNSDPLFRAPSFLTFAKIVFFSRLSGAGFFVLLASSE